MLLSKFNFVMTYFICNSVPCPDEASKYRPGPQREIVSGGAKTVTDPPPPPEKNVVVPFCCGQYPPYGCRFSFESEGMMAFV